MSSAGADDSGQVLLVTGAGSGIGRAIAIAGARHGYRLELWDIDPEGVQATASHPEVRPWLEAAQVVDVGSSAAIDNAFADAAARGVSIAHLVNNAGPSSYIRRHFEDGLQEAVASVHWMTQAWLRTTPPPGASVVNMSSVNGTVIGGPVAWYAAAKAAIVGYTRTLAMKRPGGIRANAVVPGLIRTPRTTALLDGGGADHLMARLPMARAGEPEEVAEPVLFLVGPGASYVNGAVLVIDGGFTIAF